jgi:hypothetical protein
MGSIVSSILDPITGAGAAKDAANAAAGQQREAAQASSAAAQFRPVGMTTRFGTSTFTRQTDPATGMPYVSSAGYEAAPEIAGLQNQLFAQFDPTYQQARVTEQQYAPLAGAAGQLFNLGQQYLATSPQQSSQNWMASQQNLLAPQREQQLSQLRNKLFTSGRSGLATGGTMAGGMQQTNPEMAAYYNAIANQDLGLAAQAQQQGQQQTMFGAGLYGTGTGLLNSQVGGQAGVYAPLQTQLGLANSFEQMAQQPYQLGLQLGTAMQPGQQQGANIYNQGYGAAAQTQAQGAAQAASINSSFLSSLIGSAAGAYGMGAMGGAGGINSTAAALGGNGGGGAFSGMGNFTLGPSALQLSGPY